MYIHNIFCLYISDFPILNQAHDRSIVNKYLCLWLYDVCKSQCWLQKGWKCQCQLCVGLQVSLLVCRYEFVKSYEGQQVVWLWRGLFHIHTCVSSRTFYKQMLVVERPEVCWPVSIIVSRYEFVSPMKDIKLWLDHSISILVLLEHSTILQIHSKIKELWKTNTSQNEEHIKKN